MDMFAIVNNMFRPFLNAFFSFIKITGVSIFSFIFIFFSFFLIRYRVNLFKPKLVRLRRYDIKFLPYKLLQFLLIDLYKRKRIRFKEFGFTIYVGRQGAGKTISMVAYLNRIKKKYPDCIIVTNFKYKHADYRMTDWRQFFEIRNGRKGVIFAIDEIHSEYSTDNWKDFPETLLSEISQQRKQCIKIIASSQAYKRLVKQIREQSFTVVTCLTYLSRLVRVKEYDAYEYDSAIGGGFALPKKIRALRRFFYVQTDELRNCYDTYEKIQRLEKTSFIERSQR